MGTLNKLEQRFEALVNDTFAKVFRSAVQPLEFAGALRRECDINARIWTRDCTITPNVFIVELSPGDHELYNACLLMLGEELVETVRAHAEEQCYSFVGPLKVQLQRAENLKAGQYRVRSRLEVPPQVQLALEAGRGYGVTYATEAGLRGGEARAWRPPQHVQRGDKRVLTPDQFISMGLSISEDGSLVRAVPPSPLTAPPGPLAAPPGPLRLVEAATNRPGVAVLPQSGHAVRALPVGSGGVRHVAPRETPRIARTVRPGTSTSSARPSRRSGACPRGSRRSPSIRSATPAVPKPQVIGPESKCWPESIAVITPPTLCPTGPPSHRKDKT